VTVRSLSSLLGLPARTALRRRAARACAFALLGVCAALLLSCSSSGKGLIPTGDAGPLQSDFEAVARAAENGDGDCASTESALLKTDQDFTRLPSSVDAGLRDTLRRGIENLRSRSLALCAQPLPQATTQTTPKTTTSVPTTTPTTTETQTTGTSTPSTPTPGPSGPGGGTPGPGEEVEEEANGDGKAKGKGDQGAGGIGPGTGDGGQEAGK
jgi:hypothetical protein